MTPLGIVLGTLGAYGLLLGAVLLLIHVHMRRVDAEDRRWAVVTRLRAIVEREQDGRRMAR